MTNKQIKQALNKKKAQEKLEAVAARMMAKKERDFLRSERNKKKLEKWLDGEYVPNVTKEAKVKTESVEQFIANGGTVKVLKPMTKERLKQRAYFKNMLRRNKRKR